MTIWRYDDMMIWGYDDMMIRWYDDMKLGWIFLDLPPENASLGGMRLPSLDYVYGGRNGHTDPTRLRPGGGWVVYASRIPLRRPRTLRTRLQSARNFGKTRFRRFAKNYFFDVELFCSRNFWFRNLFFRCFCQNFEELRIFRLQNQIPRHFLF